jgi:DNA polymerase
MGFWADAGVDACFADEPIDRLAEGRRRLEAPARQNAPPPPPPSPLTASRPGLDAGAVEVARQMAAATQDLEALAEAIAAFDGCPLKTMGARQSVFARGRTDARVMVIGEGPGGEEDLQGQPFVGRAGRLLDRMLDSAGLKDQVFITNTVFWRPPANRTPTPEEQAVCAPFLHRAIALVQPEFLLLVGGASAKSVLERSEGILSLRGRWVDWRNDEGRAIPALPTLHPAFLLRQPAAKKHAWADMLSLASKAASGRI